jgi:VanZ family protein
VPEIQPWQNPRTNPRPTVKLVKGMLEPQIRGWLRIWWPALLWATVIFIMSTDAFSAQHTSSILEPIFRWFIPGLTHEQFHTIHHYIRKAAHFIEYFMFCLLLYRGIRGTRVGWCWSWGLTALFIACGYSALDEIHQAFVASREASPYDSVLDSVGAFFAFAILWLWFRSRQREERIEPEAL